MEFYSDISLNIYISINSIEFRRRYRFTKETFFRHIMPIFVNKLNRHSNRGLPVPPLLTVLAALRFYATGSFQTVCGDMVFISQSTVCRIVLRVSTILCRVLVQYIKFPIPGRDSDAIHQIFYEIAGMPEVIGCIDGTHVPINNPRGTFAEIYRNRKSYFSVNVQVVGGPNLEIFDIVARWPGREHDSRIFNNSSNKIKFEEGSMQGKLLGDSAYASEPYLLTPIINPIPNSPEERYSKAHIKTRNTVQYSLEEKFPLLT